MERESRENLGGDAPIELGADPVGPKTSRAETRFALGDISLAEAGDAEHGYSPTAPVIIEILENLTEQRRAIILERSLLCLPSQTAYFMTRLLEGANRHDVRIEMELGANWVRTGFRRFKEVSAAWKDDSFDPIAWQQAHTTESGARNVLYLMAMIGENIEPDEPLVKVYERAHKWLDAQSVEADVKVMATRAFGLTGDYPESMKSIANDYNMTATKVQRKMRQLLGLPSWDSPEARRRRNPDTSTNAHEPVSSSPARSSSDAARQIESTSTLPPNLRIHEQSLRALQAMLGRDPHLPTFSQSLARMLASEAITVYLSGLEVEDASEEWAAAHRRTRATYLYVDDKPIRDIAADLYTGNTFQTRHEIGLVLESVAVRNIDGHQGRLAEQLIGKIYREASVHLRRKPSRLGGLALSVDDAPAEFVSWQDRAECRTVDPELFFPEKGGSMREAKKICRSCDVRMECLQYALESDERFGVWGGLSERERRRLKREAV